MNQLVVVLVLAAVCLAYRVMFVVIVPAERLPASARQALGHLAPAVLAALVTIEALGAASGSGPLVASLVVAFVAMIAITVRMTHSMVLAVSLGMLAAIVIDLLVLG